MRRVRDLLVACQRFSGSAEEIPGRLAGLERALDGHVVGDPIVLFYNLRCPSPPGLVAGFSPDPEMPPAAAARGAPVDIEICLPVRPSARDRKVPTRILEGGLMLCVSGAAPERAPATWGFSAEFEEALRSYLDLKELDLDNEPARQSARRRPDGTTAVETQLSLFFPRWLDRFRTGVVRHVRNRDRAFVLSGESRVGLHGSPDEQIAWVSGAIERLESVCQDPALVQRIFQGCSHRVPPYRIAWLRSIYVRTGDPHAVVRAMQTDWLRDSRMSLGGDRLEVVIGPAQPEACGPAATERDRRVAACYRTLGRRALREGIQLPRLFCYCGSGWFVELWEGILRRPVRVDVAETILWGQGHCRFVVHLPSEAGGALREDDSSFAKDVVGLSSSPSGEGPDSVGSFSPNKAALLAR